MEIERHPKFMNQLKRHEGLRLTAYRCPAGYLTIGYGHNLDACPVPGIGEKSEISEEAAEELLRQDVQITAHRLDLEISWWRQCLMPRQAVLLNMAFNMGVGGLLSFRRMLTYAKAGDGEKAANEMLCSRWAGQVTGRAVELSRQMRTGKWQDGA